MIQFISANPMLIAVLLGLALAERAAHSWLVNGKIPAREEKHGTKVWRFATVEDVDVFLATLGGLPQV